MSETTEVQCQCRKALELAFMTPECSGIDTTIGSPTYGQVLPWSEAARAALAAPCACEELRAAMDQVDDVLTVNWVGPRTDGNYRQALSDLVTGTLREHQFFAKDAEKVLVERDQLRAEIAALRQRAEAAERELAEERARLDWLEKHGHCCDQFGSGSDDRWWNVVYNDGSQAEGDTPRAAIDAARKPEVQP